MSAGNNLLKFMCVVGILLLVGQGCSQKLTQMIADSESLESMEPTQGFSSEHPGGGNEYFSVGDSAGNPNSATGNQFGKGKSRGDLVQGGPIEQARQHMSDSQSAQELGPLASFQDEGIGGGWNQSGTMAQEYVEGEWSIREAQPSSPWGQKRYAPGQQGYAQGQQGYTPGQQGYAPGQQGNSWGPQGQRLESENPMFIRVELQDVFFEYDSWRITQDGTQALVHDSEWLSESPMRSLTVEGHCDQRGTQSYNLVLGKKRAEAVRSYLVDLGVTPSQIKIVSYGKERPFCMGANENCYQLNRRGHLTLQKQ